MVIIISFTDNLFFLEAYIESTEKQYVGIICIKRLEMRNVFKNDFYTIKAVKKLSDISVLMTLSDS